LQFATHLPIVYIMFWFRKYRRSKLPLSCKIVEKGDFCRGGDTADFKHAFSDRTYFRAKVTSLVAFRSARRLEGEKKKNRGKKSANK